MAELKSFYLLGFREKLTFQAITSAYTKHKTTVSFSFIWWHSILKNLLYKVNDILSSTHILRIGTNIASHSVRGKLCDCVEYKTKQN